MNWRQLELEQSGFPRPLAAGVARDERFVVRELIALVEQGCPPEVAVRILTPLDAPEAEASR